MMESHQRKIKESLDEVDRTRAALAGRLRSPWWYHPTLGVLVAQHALVQGLDNRNWTLPSFLVLLVGCVGVVIAGRRVTGMTIATPVGPRSRNMLALRVAVALAYIWAAALTNDLWVASAAAGVVMITSVPLGRAYDSALRHDLGSPGQQPLG